ncbi:MAG TPA: UDP-N-acetylmuramoyl-L-alanine--D-glutamate ligase, partial [Chlamydiales bacterium]|nr:UDP-N-acetylmuramoyl-L-alanine--D-glutamate ligase [Chlamydiales bacterium]
VCRHLLKKGIKFVATDDKLEAVRAKPEAEFLLPYLKSVDDCLKEHVAQPVIASPGILPKHPLLQKATHILGEIELAFQECEKKKKAPILLGITGTNGKTTTTLLTTHMLHAGGIAAKAVGNIGEPLLDEIETDDVLVVELSSYQLETASTPMLSAGALLNITPDHLDHHGSMQEYALAKFRMRSCIKKGGNFYLFENITAPEARTEGFKTYGFNPLSDIRSDGESIFRFGIKEAKLPEALRGRKSHDVENFLAAFALARDADVAAQICVDSFATFQKPAHRIQFVKELNGVAYVDDSKGTNIDAVIRAVESIPNTIVLIAGGVHKGESYSSWISAFSGRVKAIYAIGQAAPLMEKDLQAAIPVTVCKNLEEAVAHASQIAKSGETVLLSPG